MTAAEDVEIPRSRTAAAFEIPAFRRIWTASLFSNLGLLIQSVGSAWAMTQMNAPASLVAMVQSSLMLPIMIFAMPAGAIADMYDRRIVALIAGTVGMMGAVAMTVSSATGVLSPYLLLACCFVIGSGMALMGPVWQASVSEQVPAAYLPSAIGLNSIAFNVARSFGPALGGVIVAAAGSVAAFGINVAFYLPALIVLYLWKRTPPPMRLPPERMMRAMASGARYIVHSPSTRTVILRTLATSMAGGSVSALMPLISRDLLGGGAPTFGILLGAAGVGAVVGAMVMGRLRTRFQDESILRVCAVLGGASVVVVGLSQSMPLTMAMLFIQGGTWTIGFSVYNIELQISAPRWVAGRALAAFQAAAAGGAGLGAMLWGLVARGQGVAMALVISGVVMGSCALLGLWRRMPEDTNPSDSEEAELLAEPEVRLGITPRSGPIVVELEYRIAPDQARAFYQLMQQIQSVRQRNGAYDWSIARDIADAERWTERFSCPTWLDYLRQRTRSTQADRQVLDATRAMHLGPEPVLIRRMLERPVGSVRWREDTPDPGLAAPLPVTPFPGGGT
jgi:MFS family permease